MENSEEEKNENTITQEQKSEIYEISEETENTAKSSKKIEKTDNESHKSVSVAEFFEKNRHLLGFNNPSKSLITSVKEAVDNSLDACEDDGVLPEIYVEVTQIGTNKYRMIVEDNGPGIEKKHLTKSFGKLLYGSKFRSHGGKQGRGQQGIGISAVILYGQLTTGKKSTLISKTRKDVAAHKYTIGIDVKNNEPEIDNSEQHDWGDKKHGIRIEVDMAAKHIKSKQSVDEYIKETSIINPHAHMVYINPEGEKRDYPRVTEILPKKARLIKPHPHGIELGILKRMIKETKSRNIKSFLTNEFDRVGAGSANEVLSKIELDPRIMPRLLTDDQQEKLLQSMQTSKLMSPSTDCLSPIGSELLKQSIQSEYDVEFVHSITRNTAVYRGYPFQIEVAIGYGGSLDSEGSAELIRFANKVPLLYQEGACAITQAVKNAGWKSYGLSQSGNAMPTGPAIIVVHMASVWVPFTSEGKEAVSGYPEILKEIKLAVQECGRSLQKYVSRKQRSEIEEQKRQIFKNYSAEVAASIYSLINPDTFKFTTPEIIEKSKDIREKLLTIAESMYTTGLDIEEEIEEPEEAKEETMEEIDEDQEIENFEEQVEDLTEEIEEELEENTEEIQSELQTEEGEEQ